MMYQMMHRAPSLKARRRLFFVSNRGHGAAGIDARAVWPSLTQQPVFVDTAKPCPISEDLAGRAMWLPTHNALSMDAVRWIADEARTATVRRLDGR